MSFKIAFIGAGSIGFTRELLKDILSVKRFQNIEIAFTDINEHNLEMVTRLCQRDIDENGLNVKIIPSMDRRKALEGAKYVINVVRIGGLDAFKLDINIPLKYGIDQCVGDTICAGGIMYAQRGIPAVLDFCKDIREVGMPGCILLNYANPNAMLTWACNMYGGVNTLGLCHGVQSGHLWLSNALGLEKEEVDIVCAGIYHQTWFIQVKHKGRDMTGKLLEAFENHPEYKESEKVRIDMIRRFGYFSTESSGHLSEYLPWYRKNPEKMLQWLDLSYWAGGETGGYLRVCTEARNWFETDFPNWLKEPPYEFKEEKRSAEHGPYIIEALETGRVYRGHFNVVNNGTITNLPDDAIVEVPGYVDRNGINIPRVGDLPLGCAAVCNASISVQRLAVEAAVKGDDFLLRQAMMMDPLTGAVCTPPEIWQLVDEMLVAEAQWLPQYGKAIEEASKRLEAGNLIKTGEYQSPARLKVKTVEEMETDRESAYKNAACADKTQLREENNCKKAGKGDGLK